MLQRIKGWYAGLSTAGRAGLWLGVFALIVIGQLVDSQTRSPDLDEWPQLAEHHCKDAIQDELKAPSSVEWHGTSVMNKEWGWRVSGELSASNSYGGRMTRLWTCDADLREGDEGEPYLHIMNVEVLE